MSAPRPDSLRPIGPASEIASERSGREQFSRTNHRVAAMLYTIAVVLLVLWLLGLVTSYTLGGFIHILVVIAIGVVLLRIIDGRRAL